MEDLFVSFDVAIKMKELGFNEPSLTVYKTDKRIMFSDDWSCGIDNEYLTKDFMACLAPTHQQCIDWLEKEYDIHISIIHSNDAYNDYRVRIYKSLDKSRYTSFYLRNGDNNLDETKLMVIKRLKS